MVDMIEDDLILESVTYFKYPSSANENDGTEVPKIKTENDVCENQQDSLESYDTRQSDYASSDSYPFHYSPYFSNQNQCNYDDQNAAYHQYNNYPVKQEIKSESYDYCIKDQDCYSSPLPYLNPQYNYHQQPPQHHQPHQQHPHNPHQQPHHQQAQHIQQQQHLQQQHPHHQQQQQHHQQQQQQHHQQQQQQQHQQQQQQQQQHQQQQQQHPQHQQQYHQQYQQQNGHYWNNGWSQPQQYTEQQCCSPQSSSSPSGFLDMNLPQALGDNNGAKKRGRKKKIKTELDDSASTSGGGSNFSVDMMQLVSDTERNGGSGAGEDVKTPVKERRKHDRFNGMPEEEVSKRTLPDLLATNLDIVIIGINPGLFAAYKGHHYAGPGNHFWKCLYLSGLITEQLTADDDYRLLQWGIGFTNMVERATKGSSDLTRKEIREGGQILLEKLQKFKPKIAVFNGKLIFEVFSGKKEFNFGRQPDFVDGTNTYMWVMPSSSARCAQLPRASDKVPYYAALKKFRDYLNGSVAVLDENDIVFQYCKLKTFPRHSQQPKVEIKAEPVDELDEFGSPSRFCDEFRSGASGGAPNNNNFCNDGPNNKMLVDASSTTTPATFGGPVIVKKKRGRPKKVRPAEENAKANANPVANVNAANSIQQPLANGNLW